MREPTFWILTALAAEPRHGYGVLQEVSRLTGGQVKLLAGTLYAALDRLTAEGLVEADHDEVVDGRSRRYYRLTSDGATALEAEAERLRLSARTARQQLAAGRPELGPALGRTAAFPKLGRLA
ncbi:PadR family transcriptional regulator [Actinoplanes cyaneus]|uniref:PadR family transcriptional regulator n=2 Tax=Actinoplanes cyaneus TaxID=52696 RepID=A0A919IWX5_9ACTN|nr:PadR family transcriptional regulator [Actinoplanes cyaneus]